MGNRTWINDGQLPTTVEQINFGLEPVNNKHKRYLVNKTISSGISNNPLSLQENQLESLVITSPTATSCGCVDSPPTWDLQAVCGCPTPIIQSYSAAVNSYIINYSPDNDYYTITVNYTRCSGNQSGGYAASATSRHYPNKNDPDENHYELQSKCIINQNIACTCGQGVKACPANGNPTCNNNT